MPNIVLLIIGEGSEKKNLIGLCEKEEVNWSKKSFGDGNAAKKVINIIEKVNLVSAQTNDKTAKARM